MSHKKIKSLSALVYSTDPDFKLEPDEQEFETIPPSQQQLKVSLDKKYRAGKSATLVTGFKGKDNDLNELGKQLKSFCSTGGSVKDGYVIVQGDNKEKVLQWLHKNGYPLAK